MASGNYTFIVWHDYDASKLNIRAYSVASGSFKSEKSVTNTTGRSFYPSLATDTYGKLHLAWSESDKIYYSKISYSWNKNS